MAHDLNDIGQRVEKLEARCDALRARVGVASFAANYVLTAFTTSMADDQDVLRTQLVKLLRDEVEKANLSKHGHKAALEQIASFELLSHEASQSDTLQSDD
ncbi:hypothetical protein D3C86_1925650 [compost metagenome]